MKLNESEYAFLLKQIDANFTNVEYALDRLRVVTATKELAALKTNVQAVLKATAPEKFRKVKPARRSSKNK